MNKGRAERIEGLEKEIMQENELKSGINTELKKRLEKAIINIDIGSNDESMLETSRSSLYSSYILHYVYAIMHAGKL